MLPIYRQLLHALGAVLVLAVPVGVAFDLGGVLSWDWWLAGALCCGLLVAAWLGESDWQVPGGGATGWRLVGRFGWQWAPALGLAVAAPPAALAAVTGNCSGTGPRAFAANESAT